MGAVFQDPASYLNPSLTVGSQLAEVLRVKQGLRRRAAHRRALELFEAVGLHQPERVFHQIPAELSGGMLQRVMIAIAISCDPQLLIADEPTTALDVTIQAEVLELLRRLRDERGLAVLFVSHDLAVISELCDRIVVFYAGEIVESGPAEEIIERPRHPYTQALLRVASVGDFRRRELEVIAGQPPRVGEDITGCRFAERCPVAVPACRAGPVRSVPVGDRHQARCVLAARAAVASGDRGPATATAAALASVGAPPLLAVESVDVALGRGWRANQVLSGVDLNVWPGEIVGLVGETGSGKTTLARTVVGLVDPRRGRVRLDGSPSPRCAGAPGGPSGAAGTCSWCSRTRCARSTRT